MAYTYTASLVTPKPKLIAGFPGVRLVFGSINLSNYDTNKVAIAEIVSAFKSNYTVMCGPSSNGYRVMWDTTTTSFKVFMSAGTVSAPTITTTTNAGTTTPVYTNGGALTQVAGATGITGVQAPTYTGAAATEITAGINVGTFQVFAIGI